ncbi:hypothetical protein PF004_g3363 [Phytophthora fragariae]|uniref:Uncharacterized protein n=1 Tax=Phytophthora fragariae TaxID=53985 RepID=A0A6A3MET2_9STRA|nr:hypothetical protein PF011_g357 [Phytophthora fragariae]KAE9249493.1 hypothetical protein PF004_g3363 [Phytophthora fragariae]
MSTVRAQLDDAMADVEFVQVPQCRSRPMDVAVMASFKRGCELYAQQHCDSDYSPPKSGETFYESWPCSDPPSNS